MSADNLPARIQTEADYDKWSELIEPYYEDAVLSPQEANYFLRLKKLLTDYEDRQFA